METGKWAKPSINTSQYAIYYPQITGSFSAQRQMPSVYSNALLQVYLPVAVRAALPVHINSATVQQWLVSVLELSWHAGTEGLSGTAQRCIWYSEVGWPSRPSDVAETTNTVTRRCTFRRSIATDHMKWRPLLYRSLSTNHDKLWRRRNIKICNVLFGSVPPFSLCEMLSMQLAFNQ
jgi:hypothetical protein